MDDQNNQSNPSNVSVNNQQQAPNQPTNVADSSVSSGVPTASQPTVSQNTDNAVSQQPSSPQPTMPQNEDLQKISNDLENLAKEAESSVAGTPQPTEPAPAVVAVNPVQEPQTESVEPQAAEKPEEKPEEGSTNITVYTTASCPFCKTEKDFLNTEGLAFTEKNVEEDNEALKQMLTLSDNFAGVPVTSVEGPKGKKVIKGFTKNEFITELKSVGIEVKTQLSEEAAAPTKPEETAAPTKPEAEQNLAKDSVPNLQTNEPVEPVASQPQAPVAEQPQPETPAPQSSQPEVPAAPVAEEPKVPDLN